MKFAGLLYYWLYVVLFICLNWFSSIKSYTTRQSRQTCTTPTPSIALAVISGSRVVSLPQRTTWRKRLRQCWVWCPGFPWTIASRIFCRQCIWWNIATPTMEVMYISLAHGIFRYQIFVLRASWANFSCFKLDEPYPQALVLQTHYCGGTCLLIANRPRRRSLKAHISRYFQSWVRQKVHEEEVGGDDRLLHSLEAHVWEISRLYD